MNLPSRRASILLVLLGFSASSAPWASAQIRVLAAPAGPAAPGAFGAAGELRLAPLTPQAPLEQGAALSAPDILSDLSSLEALPAAASENQDAPRRISAQLPALSAPEQDASPSLGSFFDGLSARQDGSGALSAAPEDSLGAKKSGNPLIDSSNLGPLLPSAYDKATWTGRVTLHLHSVYSDGTMTPEELVEAAYKAGAREMSLTDHDTTAGTLRAWKKAKELGMAFHPGVELSARNGAHIGAIDVDVTNKKLAALLERMRALRLEKAKLIIGNINKMDEMKKRGVQLTIEEVAAKSKYAEGGTIEIPHIARALLDRGLITSVDQAYGTFLKGSAFDGLEKYLDPEASEVLSIIRAAGGKAVLNHPYTIRDSAAGAGVVQAEQDALIKEILDQGVDAIEIYRPSHATSEDGKKRADARAAKYLAWADQYSVGKVVAAAPGSDFHGKDTHLDRLAVWMPKALSDQLLESLSAANAAALKALEVSERPLNPAAWPALVRILVVVLGLAAALTLAFHAFKV